MAQLKDTVVQGSLRVTDTTYTNNLNITSLTASYAVLTDADKNLVSRAIYNRTSKGDLEWTSNTADVHLITKNTLAYWNGRYNSSTSNLTYCNKGAFGDAVTYGVKDAAANGALVQTGTGLTTERSVYYGLVIVNNASQTRATSIYAPTSAGTANQILVSAGGTSAPTWKATANGAAYATSSNGALTFGTLPTAQGGTGNSSYTAGRLLYTNTATKFATSDAAQFDGTNLTLNGTLLIKPTTGNYTEGIRISPYNSWSTIMLLGSTAGTATSGVTANDWGIFNYDGNLRIARGSSTSGNMLGCDTNNMWALANCSTTVANYTTVALQLRESNRGGSQSDVWAVAPRLGFHWSGRNAAQIALGSGGQLYECPGTGTTFYKIAYESLGAFNLGLRTYSIGSGSSSQTHAEALQNYFNSYKSTVQRSSLIGLYSSAHGNGSMCMGYFLSGYDTNPYGGFFVCNYNWPYYVGIANGTFTEFRLWKTGDAVTGAVWNDYAEFRTSECKEFGYVVMETGNDTLTKTTERLSHFAGVTSDTWGFSQGETDTAKTPLAVAGRVLVYTYKNRKKYKPGDCVCAAPNGTVDIMTRDEVVQFPDRIVGTVSCVPEYEEWGGGKNADRDPVKVNGRIWIKVR